MDLRSMRAARFEGVNGRDRRAASRLVTGRHSGIGRLANGDAWDELVDVCESEGVVASIVVAGVTSRCQMTPPSRDHHRTAETERRLPAKPAYRRRYRMRFR